MNELIISNLQVASGKEYQINYNSLDKGSIQYIDRNYLFDYIPDFLRGENFIKTAGNDKMITENKLCFSFEINVPVTVYIVYADKLKILPKWLEEYNNIREKITRQDSNTSTLKGIFSLFSKDFEAGKISLGGNLADEMLDDQKFKDSGPLGTNYCMYSVILVKR